MLANNELIVATANHLSLPIKSKPLKTNPSPRILTTVFNLPLYPRQLRQWRGAVSAQAMEWKDKFNQAGIPTHLFHNHNEESGDIRHRYPLLQFKIIDRQAAITGIGQGADALALWLRLFKNTLLISGRQTTLQVIKQTDTSRRLQRTRKPQHYRMYVWKALNAADMPRWNEDDRLTQRVQLLDEKLHRHLLQLAAALEWNLKPETLKAYMCYLGQTEKLEGYHPGKYLAFSGVFACNLLLPDEVAIGQEVAVGFGRLQALPGKS